MRQFVLITILCFVLGACVQNQGPYESASTYQTISSTTPYTQSGMPTFTQRASNSAIADSGGPSQLNIKLIGHWKVFILENAGLKSAMIESTTNPRAFFTVAVTAMNGKLFNLYSLVVPNMFNWPSGATIPREASLIIGNKTYTVQTINNVNDMVIGSMIQMPPNFIELASRNKYFSINLQGVQIAKIVLEGFQEAYTYASKYAKQIEIEQQ